jgi:hypothetical protein
LQRSLVVDYWGPERFHLALWQALVLGLAACAIAFQATRHRFTLIMLLGIAAVALVLQLTFFRWFWETVPLVRFIQFPWRLLGLVSFCAALLTGSLFLLRPLRGRLGTAAAVALLGAIMLLGILRLRPELSPGWSQATDEQISQVDLFEAGKGGYEMFTDYIPAGLSAPIAELSLPRPPGVAESARLPARPEVRVVADGSTHIRLQVTSDAAVPLRLHRFYFPGWRAYVDGRPVPTGPSGVLGLVTATIPAGSHQVDFRFGNTALRSVAVAISLISLAILVWIVSRSRQRKPVLLAVTGIALVLFTLVFLHQGRGEPARQPTAYAADFQDEVSLLGYYLPKTTWKSGETVPVRLYWLAEDRLSADYKVFLHLARLDDSGIVAQSDSAPILGYGPTSWWEPGEVVVDQQMISLAADVPSGRYRLLVGLYRPDTMQNLAVRQAPQALTGDRVALSEIEVAIDQ